MGERLASCPRCGAPLARPSGGNGHSLIPVECGGRGFLAGPLDLVRAFNECDLATLHPSFNGDSSRCPTHGAAHDLPTGAGERPVGSQAGAVVSGDDGPGPNGGGSC